MNAREETGLPRIVLRGSPYERGLRYGQLARDRIRRSMAFYGEVFQHHAGLSWEDAIRMAGRYRPYIADFSPDSLLEMQGIAEGAGLTADDILVLNARSELMFSSATRPTVAAAGECTSFAVLPDTTANGHTYAGQNWDWIPTALETAVVLEVHRDDKPSYVTVAEAGHLAKAGMNDAGLAVCTNTLVSNLDGDRVGVPYHIVLRSLFDAPTISAATRMIYAAQRAFSANYLLAHRDGLAVNIETTSGDARGVSTRLPKDGLLVHTNHFAADDFKQYDIRVNLYPGSLFRLDDVRRNLRREDRAVTLEGIQHALRSHHNALDSVCWHPDPAKPALDRRATITSIIMDLDAGEFLFTAGPPCLSDYTSLRVGARIGEQENATPTDG